MKLVNIGCGRHFHPAWLNLDMVSHDRGVIAHDLRRGFPLDDDECDAVYHSHVLEHLRPAEGMAMLRECWRVLRPGGIVRVVVPDLEGIVRCYLEQLELARQSDVPCAHLEWMRLELVDQMVRDRGGGEMLKHVTSLSPDERRFVTDRMGLEFDAVDKTRQRKSIWHRLSPGSLAKKAGRLKRDLACLLVSLLVGRSGYRAFKEGLFRNSGEVHRWMYDEIALRDALQKAGFVDASVQRADQSLIPDFAAYSLDTVAGQVRKPDSLFMEGVKPRRGNCGNSRAA